MPWNRILLRARNFVLAINYQKHLKRKLFSLKNFEKCIFSYFSVLHRYPCGVVANTDPSNKPGTHWVAFYFPSAEKGEFFDSYRHSPDYYNNSFKSFLETHSSEWSFNNRKLQTAWSDVCGQYCIFYLSHRARGMKKIEQLFGKDTVLNDSKVAWFVKTHFKIKSNRSRNSFVQCCKKLIE